jgi:hypothetical protein
MKTIAGFIGILAFAACAPLAQASLQISYQVDGNPAVVCNTGSDTGPVTCNATIGNVAISNTSGSSNSPGTATNANTFNADLSITSTTAHTLQLWFSAQDFTRPNTPPAIDFSSSLSITSISGSGSVVGVSCVDTGNGLAPPTSTFCASGPSITNATETYSGSSSKADTQHSTISSLGPALFSMSEHITITLGAGSALNVITSSVLAPTPEPMSIVLLGGVVLLTSRLIRRKQNRSAQV